VQAVSLFDTWRTCKETGTVRIDAAK